MGPTTLAQWDEALTNELSGQASAFSLFHFVSYGQCSWLVTQSLLSYVKGFIISHRRILRNQQQSSLFVGAFVSSFCYDALFVHPHIVCDSVGYLPGSRSKRQAIQLNHFYYWTFRINLEDSYYLEYTYHSFFKYIFLLLSERKGEREKERNINDEKN
uniref:Uncharacterized protein n=1 Tax=Pipistrellus kuhlii TaxID=59472 RepID=A0A7J7RTJ7_PIPKU|nr:hypothetical protein mPipKuh1_010241 [Pipistrellus kuhlii]